jgi:hypothetical protein
MPRVGVGRDGTVFGNEVVIKACDEKYFCENVLMRKGNKGCFWDHMAVRGYGGCNDMIPMVARYENGPTDGH